MNNKQKLVYLSLIALTIIGILSGASYAYFSVENKIGNETVIESGTMALTFTDGSTITADKLIPGEYIEKTFSVRNTGTVRTNYDIYLSEVVNTFVNQSDLVYEIISSNGYNTSNQIQVPNTETKIINNYPIDPLQEHTYTLRITYKITNEVQNDNMGRTFIAKININEYNQNNSERYIKLYDASNNEIDKQVLTNNSDYYYPLSNINLSNSTNIYCDNGGIPTIENNQLKVSEVTSETNCRISNNIVDTINNKLTTSKTGIVMTNNQNNVVEMKIPSDKELILDMNGKEITATNQVIISNDGILTINSSNGKGTLKTNVNVIGYNANSNQTTTLSNVNIISTNATNASAIYVHGMVIVNDGTYIEGPYGLGSFTSTTSKAIVNGGEIYGSRYNAIQLNGSNVTETPKLIINGGLIRGNNNALSNSNETININQSVNPIYITSLAKDWKPAIYNTTGTININANQADNCTSNSSDTTSGLCVYAEGNKVFDDFKSNIAVRIESNEGVLNINGGTYYGGYESISSYGISKIENANVISPRAAIVNHNIMCVCNTTVNAPTFNLHTRGSKLVYSNVTFLNRAPNITNVGSGTVTEVDTCPIVWPED